VLVICFFRMDLLSVWYWTDCPQPKAGHPRAAWSRFPDRFLYEMHFRRNSTQRTRSS